MITVTQARENDRTTFCRQFTFNKNGYSNRELDGAIVSGMVSSGMNIEELPIGSKVALTEASKKYPNEVGYFVSGLEDGFVEVLSDAHAVQSTWDNRSQGAAQALEDMSEKAKSVVQLKAAALPYSDVTGGYSFFNSDARRSFPANWWTETKLDNIHVVYVKASGAASQSYYENSGTTLTVRPVFKIPFGTLVSAQPNEEGAYELL